MFTSEELAEMAAADDEVEATFTLTMEDIQLAKELDRAAHLDGLPKI